MQTCIAHALRPSIRSFEMTGETRYLDIESLVQCAHGTKKDKLTLARGRARVKTKAKCCRVMAEHDQAHNEK